MSDYHIREIAKDRKTVDVVYHLPVPTGNNTVGTPWRTAVTEYKGGADAITSVLPDIPAEDLTKLKNGELIETAFAMRFSSTDLTDLQRIEEVKEKYRSERAEVSSNLQAILNYYGKKGDV